MHQLDSAWFFRLVEKQAGTPAGRLLAVFRVVDGWVAAPATRELLRADLQHTLSALRSFLAQTARAAHARQPEALAEQLLLLLRGAIAHELRDPGSRALEQAAQAAEAALAHACRRNFAARRFAGGFTAGILATFAALHALDSPQAPHTIPPTAYEALAEPATPDPNTLLALRLLHQRLAQGSCPTPQLLGLSHAQMDGYMQVAKFTPTGHAAADWDNMQAFLAWYERAHATECYIPPSNGHTTVAWVSRPS